VKRVLITGGAGFIGSHTADALARKKYAVRILDNLDSVVHGGKWPAYVLGKSYELLKGDVRERKDWLRALRGVSHVLHLSAYQDQRSDFSTFFEVNSAGTALLYELIVEKKLAIKKVVVASSQFVYGDGIYQCPHNGTLFMPQLRTNEMFEGGEFDILCRHGAPAKYLRFKENQALTPTNSYGLSKEAVERLSLRLGRTYDIPTTILRYSIVQGARQSPRNLYSGALRIFVTQALKGKPITVFEDGRSVRDFVHVADVVRANVLALENRRTDLEVYNVGGGKAWRVLDFAKLVRRMADSKSPITIGGFRRTDTRHAVSDIGKLKRLGWRPRLTPEDSIREYLAWYRAGFL
jgi:dTDP-L-rhamnose 4-epimerase